MEAKAKEEAVQALKGDTFAETAALFLAVRGKQWGATHAVRSGRLVKNDLNPWLGHRPMREITTPELKDVIRKIEQRGAYSLVDKALTLCGVLWDFARVEGKADTNIARGMRSNFIKPTTKHFPAITDPDQFAQLLKSIDAYHGGAIAKAALRLAPLVFQRPGELRGMAWSELDLEAAMWTIPAARMKRKKDGKENGEPHLVPLSRQAVAILESMQAVTGGGALVFRSERDHAKPMSENTLRVALMSMGYPPEVQTVHGFRASARTMLAEVLNIDPLVVEQQLAHAVKDSLGRAYNRATYMKHRIAMMQQWADYLDGLKSEKVIQLRRKA